MEFAYFLQCNPAHPRSQQPPSSASTLHPGRISKRKSPKKDPELEPRPWPSDISQLSPEKISLFESLVLSQYCNGMDHASNGPGLALPSPSISSSPGGYPSIGNGFAPPEHFETNDFRLCSPASSAFYMSPGNEAVSTPNSAATGRSSQSRM